MVNHNITAKLRANEIRNKLGLGQQPVADIINLLEELGIIVFKKPLRDSNISALFMKDRKNYLVVINSNRTLGHQFFSAAHELHHFFYDQELSGRACDINLDTDALEKEYLANNFASHFLMPEEGVISVAEKRKNKAGNLELYDIVFLQQYFKVSWISMLRKLNALGYINQVEKYRDIGITGLTQMMGYDVKLVKKTKDTYVSKKYLELVLKCLDNDEISRTKAAEYLKHVGLDINNIVAPEDLVKKGKDYDD